MEGENKQICRLCLNKIDEKNFELIEDLQKEMLKVILIDLNFSITEEPVMCNDCSQNLQKCFNFKMSCLNTEDCVKTFANCQEYSNAKVNIWEIILKEVTQKDRDKEKQEICRLCFSLDSDNFIKLNALDTSQIRHMLKNCIPEVKLNLTEDPLICEVCVESLRHKFSFVKTCFRAEQQIKRYCSMNDRRMVYPVDLGGVLEYFKTVNFESDTDAMRIGEFDKDVVISENMLKTEADASEELQIDNILQSTSEPDELDRVFPSTNTLVEPTVVLMNCIKPLTVKLYPCKQCSYKATNKRDLKIHHLSHGTARRLYECSLCPFITRHRNVIDNHQLTHKSLDEIEWQLCSICTFRTKLKANLRNHMQTHKVPEDQKRFKCEDCNYRTLWRRDLERHIIKHKEPGQTTMFKCDFCAFSTKHQRYLKYHIDKLHLKTVVADDSKYSCAQCNFTTKLKRCLIPHMLVHRNPEELVVYKCSVCPYQAKWRESVKKHELIHKNQYKCDECEFETNLRRFLVKHKLAHRSLEDMPVYSCDKCNYQTRHKQGLQKHTLVHKTADEIQMHACPHCEYKSKRLPDLKQHVLTIHTDNITIYACEHCAYQTKYKNNFRQHIKMIHKIPSDMTMYKCEKCSFETKYKSSLQSHIVSYHKSVEEITMLKCTKCDFQTKRKECLTMHMVTHKNPKEMDLFQCDHCGFQTKYKRALKRHLEGHRPGGKQRVMFLCNCCGFETKWKQTIRKHCSKHVEAGEAEDGDPAWTVEQKSDIVKEEVVLI